MNKEQPGNQTRHTFKCPKCGAVNATTLDKVDQVLACTGCHTEVVVPKPRVRIAKGEHGPRRGPPVKGQPVHSANSVEAQPGFAGTPRTTEGNQGSPAGFGHGQTGGAGLSGRKTPKSGGRLEREHGLGFLAGAMIGLIIYFGFVGDIRYSPPVTSDAKVQADAELVLRYWRAAENSLVAIEDLRITLTEMELNGMVEAAADVERFIEKHRRDIDGYYKLSLDALLSISQNYVAAPSATEEALNALYDRLQSSRAAADLQTLDMLTNILYTNQDNLGVTQAYEAQWAGSGLSIIDKFELGDNS